MNFERCDDLTDVAVKYLAEKCRSLQRVRCPGCEKLTDEAVKRLAEMHLACRAGTSRGATSSRTRPSRI